MNGWNDGIMWATIIQMFMKKSSAVNAQLWADINGSFTYTARTRGGGGAHFKVTLENTRVTFVEVFNFQRSHTHFTV